MCYSEGLLDELPGSPTIFIEQELGTKYEKKACK